MTTLQKWIVAIVLCSQLGGRAAADEIVWSYNSQGGTSGGYFITGSPTILMNTSQGQRDLVFPYQNYGPRTAYISPSVFIVTKVTITDQSSNESKQFNVSYFLSSSESDFVNPYIDMFQPQKFTLGNHSYEVTEEGGKQLLFVKVDVINAAIQTPEPTTLVMASIGLIGIGLGRRRYRQRTC